MNSSLLIKNGRIATAVDSYEADIYIIDEKVQQIGKDLNYKADKVIDAKNCLVIPGGIDAHTHMELPFMGTFSSDSFESGTLAGLYGGTTTIIDFAIQSHGKGLKDAFSTWYNKAHGNAVCDYSFHVAITDLNIESKAEIKELIEQFGVSSFKTFMAYKNALMVTDQQLVELFNELKKYGAMLTTHAENGELIDFLVKSHLANGDSTPKFHPLSRPEIAEAEASGRVIDLAYHANAPLYIVHMTSEQALNRVRESTKRNQKVFVETCIQYLLLDVALYDQGFEGAKWVMSPPLRQEKDRMALWSGINQNLVQVVATDHCPFCMAQKELGKDDFSKIPNGSPGIEHRIELLYSEGVVKKRISLNKFVEVSSTMPAKIFGLFPRKGTIAIGSDADIVIFDPNIKHTISAKTHHMNCDYSAYEGWQVQGKCKTTILRGKVVIDDGVAVVSKGYGQYLPRNIIKNI